MRRRNRADPGDLPPAELRTFTPRLWADVAAWTKARAVWRDAHGWPTDSVDYYHEQRAERRAAKGVVTVRRRNHLPAVDMPPRELLEFCEDEWAPFAPAFHPRVDFEGSNATEPVRKHLRTIEAWCEARQKWRDAHGWPTDSIEFLREEVAVRIPGIYDRKR